MLGRCTNGFFTGGLATIAQIILSQTVTIQAFLAKSISNAGTNEKSKNYAWPDKISNRISSPGRLACN